MDSFIELGLSESLLRAIGEMGFEKPTAIQQQAIPQLLNERRDLIAIAQTGTGKTAAFGLPLLHNIDTTSKDVQALVLCPTRELCLQLAKDLKNYAKHDPANILAVYGGAHIGTQIKALKNGKQVIVGTPGRTLDLIKRKKLDLSKITYVVLDEADEMLSMGFKEELDEILSYAPDERQTLFFSATMPNEIRALSKKYMDNPASISVGSENRNNKQVTHIAYSVASNRKYQILKRLIDAHPNIYGIIFCRTRAQTKEIAEKLTEDNYSAEAIHGELSQAQRDHVMNKFRNKQIELLVATDVAARGIDVNNLTHVINYNLPDDLETYVHRSGRTGRAGNKGISIVLLSGRDKSKLKRIERHIEKTFDVGKVPSSQEIIDFKMQRFFQDLASTEIDESLMEKHAQPIKDLFENVTKEELLQKLISKEFKDVFAYYKLHHDSKFKQTDSGRGDRDGRKKRREESWKDRKNSNSDIKFTKFYINVGKKQKISPKTIFQLVNRYLPRKNVEVGNIIIKSTHTFFELDARSEKEALKAFKKAKYRAKKIHVEVVYD